MLAETLFPGAYREDAPLLVELVRAYLEWEESQGPTYHARRLLDYGDVDLAPDAFLGHLRAKFLDGVVVPPTANLRMLLKRCTDLLRARGSPRALDAFFRLAYQAGADVYYPSADLLRPSAGRYVKPRYLEVAVSSRTALFVGRQVVGTRSGAQAFVERAFRKLIKGKLVDSLALSAVEGQFQTGELVDYADAQAGDSNPARVVGSLTSLDVIDGASGMSVGDVVDLDGGSGSSARGRVVSTEDLGGRVSFELVDGGYGYALDSECLVSANVVTLVGVAVDRQTNGTDNYFSFLETLSQPVANLGFAPVTPAPARGDAISMYSNSTTKVADALVLSYSVVNSTVSSLVASVTNAVGNVAATTFANCARYSINVSSCGVTNTTGRVIGEKNQVSLTLDAAASAVTFVGDTMTQPATNATGRVSYVAGNVVTLSSRIGVFVPSQPISSDSRATSANAVSVSVGVGIDQLSGGFLADPLALTTASTSNTRATGAATVSAGYGASFRVASVDDTETVSLVTDMVSNYASVSLSANAYGFPADPSANSSQPSIAAALSTTNVVIGRVSAVMPSNPGTGYTQAPVVRVYEPRTFSYQRLGWVADVQSSGSFAPGELVEQPSTGARGIVVSANQTSLALRCASLLADLRSSADVANSTIVGTDSGATAVVASLRPYDLREPDDCAGRIAGADAAVSANTTTANGVVTGVVAEVSGFGYVDGDVVSFGSPDGTQGSGVVRLGSAGVGQGYYRTTPASPSSEKRVFDGRYWQELSYEVRSAAAPQLYEPAMRFLHPVGTARFSRLRHASSVSAQAGCDATTIRQHS